MFSIIIRFLVTIAVLLLIGLGVYDYLHNIDENDCTMTYMVPPVYIPIRLNQQIQQKYPRYKLYFQCINIYNCDLTERISFKKPGNIPVLFITGNADSHQQVRSIASIALSKAEQDKYAKRDIRFNYFTIGFNEELSALFGPILYEQTDFVRHCVKHILTLYDGVSTTEQRPTSVLIVGNSMGGLIARGLFVKSPNVDFDAAKYIHTIITQAAPHTHAVVNMDYRLKSYYNEVNQFWLNKTEVSLNNVILVSLYGGNRDILVRNGLSHLNDNWSSNSNALIISKLTDTIPYVWRSVDHRCMSWCKELMLVMNRALFKLIDTETRQIASSKAEREFVLKHYFVNDNVDIVRNEQMVEEQNKYPKQAVQIISDLKKANLLINDYNKDGAKYLALSLIALRSQFEANGIDGLFVYTNLNRYGTFVGCKDFILKNDEYVCLQPFDLFEKYGASVPPNELGRDIGLKFLHIQNTSQVLKDYSHIVVRQQNWPRSSVNYFQAILKMDWYSSKQRVHTAITPSILSHSKIEIKIPEEHVFTRYYLDNFDRVTQVFDLKKQNSNTNCDLALQKHPTYALLSSCVQIKFTLNNDEFYYSQILNKKSRNLTLKLTKNSKQIENYVDFINFNFTNLFLNTNKLKYDNCSNEQTFELGVASYVSMFGQIVKFYLIYLPAFLALQLQLFDYSNLKCNNNAKPNSFFILNKFQIDFKRNLNVFVGLMCLSFANKYIQGFNTDFEQLQNDDAIWSDLFTPVMYGFSYSIISFVTFIFSFLYFAVSLVINKVLFKIINFFNFLKHLGFFVFLLAVVAGGFFASTLTHCLIFYGELICLAYKNPYFNDAKNDLKQSKRFLKNFIRLFLLYLLIVLNTPLLIVWLKSIEFHGVKPLMHIMEDPYATVAFLNSFILILNYFKNNFCLNLNMPNVYLSKIILANAFIGVFYSCVNLYRLPYFILFHLFFMVFENEDEFDDKQKME